MAKVAVLLIAGSPVLFALSTWSTVYTFNPIRSYSLPIILIELSVIFLSIVSGDILPAFRAVGRNLLIPLTLIAGIQIYTTLFVSANRDAAVIQLATTWIHVAFAFACKGLFDGRVRASVLSASVVGLGLFVILVYLLALSVASPPEFDWLSFGAASTNVRHLGYYGAVLTGISLGLYTQTRWAMVGVVLGLALILWTGSRGGVFAVGGSLFVAWAVLDWRKARAMTLACSVGFLAALALASIWVPPHPSWGPASLWGRSGGAATEASDPSNGRAEIWAETTLMALERPAFGWGEGQFKYNVPTAGEHSNHPHNSVIQFLYQWGVVGLASVLFLLAVAVKMARRSLRYEEPTALPAFVAACCLLSFSLVDGTLYYPFPIMMLAVCLAVMANAHPKQAVENTARPS